MAATSIIPCVDGLWFTYCGTGMFRWFTSRIVIERAVVGVRVVSFSFRNGAVVGTRIVGAGVEIGALLVVSSREYGYDNEAGV